MDQSEMASRGGIARWKGVSKKKRTELARAAVRVRWAKYYADRAERAAAVAGAKSLVRLRNKKLSPARRSEIASKAARAKHAGERIHGKAKMDVK